MRPPTSAAPLVAVAAAVVAAIGWWLTEQPAAAPASVVAELTVATPPPVASTDRAPRQDWTRLPKLERNDDGLADQALHAAINDPSASDLPLQLFRRTSRLAADIVVADTTGAGRRRWSRYWGDETARAEPCCTSVSVDAAGSSRDPHYRRAVLARVLWSGTDRRGQDLVSQATILRLVHRNGRWRPKQPHSNRTGATSP